MTENDKNWGPFTWGPWHKSISILFCSGNRFDDEEESRNHLMLIGFGKALRIRLPKLINPCKPKGDYQFHPREYGFNLSDQGGSYDFLSVRYGPQTNDSVTTKSWHKFLPWTQWRHVRTSIYDPDGTHFATEEKGKWREFCDLREKCPSVHFGFEDYDGEMIVATCRIEEREWIRGEGWFKWLSRFYQPLIRRVLDLHFSAEVGSEKGSWKGGTTGHSIDMLPGETPQRAFVRYCAKGSSRKGRTTILRFIGPCSDPKPKFEHAHNDFGGGVEQ
jgi:hypothetical protein